LLNYIDFIIFVNHR